MSSPSLLAATSTIGWSEVLLRLFVATALGGAIGLERELRERQAGLRTHLVVSVGAALFTIVSAYGFAGFAGVDRERIAAGVVTGIGFLGAGAIIRQGLSVRGLTTAASLWLVAAIGMAAGAGFWAGAVIATLGALLTLGPLRHVAFRVLRRYRPGLDRLLVELPAGRSPGPVVEAIERSGGRVVSLDVAQEGERRSVAVDVELPPGTAPVAVVTGVAEVEGVLEVQWTD